MNKKTNAMINNITKVLAGVGALNWGLVGFLGINLVEALSVELKLIVYGAIAASGLNVILIGLDQELLKE